MPTIEEMRFDSRARAEGRQKALALPEAHLVALMNAQREESEKSTTRIRDQWSESMRYYQSEVDYGDKEDWQSAVWIPIPWTAVKQATAVLKRSLLDSPDYFRVDGVDQRDKFLADQVWNPLIKFAFHKCGFMAKMIHAIEVSLVTGQSLYLKFRYPSLPSPILDSLQLQADAQGNPLVMPQYRMQRQAALTVEGVPPWKVYRDPQSRPGEQWSGTYMMHEDYVDRAVLTSAAAAGIYKNIETILQPSGATSGTGSASDAASKDARQRGQTWEPHQFRKPVLASEWYGDILDENGDMVYPDAMMVMGDRKAVLYGPGDNPLWAVDPKSFRRKWPFIGFSPLPHPLRFEGWGILQAVTPLAVLFSNLFNLFSDGLNWKVNQPTELNTALLDDDDEEHYPGKLWRKTGDGQLLSAANLGQMDVGSILAALQFMQQLWENNSFVNNFVQGTEGTRRQITKGEVQIRTGQSLGMFDSMAKDIELGGMAALELAYDFLLQYTTDWGDSTLANVVGPQLATLVRAMDPVARMRELSGQFNYTFTGITASLQKSELLGRLLQAAQIAAEGPYMGHTNPSQVLGVIYDALGVRDKITVTEEPMIPVSKIDQIVAGMMAPAGQHRLPKPSVRELGAAPSETAPAGVPA